MRKPYNVTLFSPWLNCLIPIDTLGLPEQWPGGGQQRALTGLTQPTHKVLQRGSRNEGKGELAV